MSDPAKLAALRKLLATQVKPDARKAKARFDALLPKLTKVVVGLDKAIADENPEKMQLFEDAFSALEKGDVADLVTTAESQLARLDKLAESPEFVEELAAFESLTEELRHVRGALRGWLRRGREDLARSQALRPGLRKGAADLAQLWAVAGRNAKSARANAADVLAQMKALRADAGKALKSGALARLLGQVTAATRLDEAAAQVAVQLGGAAINDFFLRLAKGGMAADVVASYEKDAKKLREQLDAAAADVAQARKLKAEIDAVHQRAAAADAAIAKVLAVAGPAAARILKTLWQDPGKLPKTLEELAKSGILPLPVKQARDMVLGVFGRL